MAQPICITHGQAASAVASSSLHGAGHLGLDRLTIKFGVINTSTWSQHHFSFPGAQTSWRAALHWWPNLACKVGGLKHWWKSPVLLLLECRRWGASAFQADCEQNVPATCSSNNLKIGFGCQISDNNNSCKQGEVTMPRWKKLTLQQRWRIASGYHSLRCSHCFASKLPSEVDTH